MRKLKLFKAIVATRSTRSESSTEGKERARERERESFRERKKWEIGVSERSKPKGH